MTASDFYEWAADCARELEQLERRRDALRLPKSNGTKTAHPSGSGDPTATQAIAAMQDEPWLQEGIDRCKRVLQLERKVTGSVCTTFGSMAALALQLHYREGNEWQDIAYELHMSLSSVYRLRKSALEWVDAEGLVASVGKS